MVAAVLGLLVFSGSIPLGENKEGELQGTITIWGTFRADIVNTLLDEFNTANPTVAVSYIEKSKDNFDQNLLEALASGRGPDMFFLSQDLAYNYGNKILVIPYASYSLGSFKNNFATASEVFLTPSGISAFPMLIDPLVMYYNRSILDSNGITTPPTFWDELVNLVPTLTKKDDTNKINKNTIALGHFSNVSHAKDILATLFMQTGNNIVKEKDGRFAPDLSNDIGSSSEQVLEFYTDFADPNKNLYSWNKSFPMSRDYFSTNNMAFYLGYASELPILINKNPNQNFLVAPIPQIKNTTKVTMAQVVGLAISRFSQNQNTAFLVAGELSNGDFSLKLAQSLGMVPARRDLLSLKPADAYNPVFYSSALFARSWLDPSKKDTDILFSNMINGVLSNTFESDDAISDATNKLYLLLNR